MENSLLDSNLTEENYDDYIEKYLIYLDYRVKIVL